MISRNTIATIILMLTMFIIILIVMMPSLQNTQTSSTATRTIIIIGILFAVVIGLQLLRKEGALPTELISNYLPFPLVLLKLDDNLLQKIEKYVLPAIEETIALIKEGDAGERPYRIMKHIYDFFFVELGFRPAGADKLLEKFKELYTHIPIKDEKTSAAYSLACLVLWIFKYRNLTFHHPRRDPDPIDAWFALRTLLIYLKEKYRVEKAVLYSKCPKCGNVNKVILHEGQIQWLKEINVTCTNTECKYEYKVKLTPQAIREHYKIINKQ